MDFRTVVPTEYAKKLVAKARECGEELADCETGGSGWRIAKYDVSILLDCFPRLKMKDAYTFLSFQLTEGGNGNGLHMIVTQDEVDHLIASIDPESFELGWTKKGEPIIFSGEKSINKHISTDVYSVLLLEDDPLAYFECAVFCRELKEVGAMWHGAWWSSHHMILTDDPDVEFGDCGYTLNGISDWDWEGGIPDEWCPCVASTEKETTVQFYTACAAGGERLTKHIDRYADGKRIVMPEKMLASGGSGFVY